ncbi:MAG TPA: hypothetical protein LFV66_01445 [Rickettsia endosymbiont of Bembidion lapponicum]|nr:hypothetical protein [Rickettsia endosymbiont of Bembidion lapponicum]
MVAAATNVVQKITGVEGKYDKNAKKYLPPAGYRDWEEVARKNNIHLIANDNVKITLTNGKILSLNDYELKYPAKKMQQNPSHAEELEKVQTKLANCLKENKLAAPSKVDQYLKSEASQDRQEVMKDSKLPFKDKIYKLIGKMSGALGISSLKNYC